MAFPKREEFIDEPLSLQTAVKLSKDLKEASKTLGTEQGRFLVKQYYTTQESRIAARHQARKLLETNQPIELISYVGDQFELVELQIKNALQEWVDQLPVGQWLQSIKGIGPVITAGLLANIDITKAPAVSSIWRFAGLDPTSKWEKGQKRPWNADLKVLTVFKAGESFVKVQNRDGDVYGHIFATYKKKITAKNESFGFKDTAAHLLATKKYDKTTDVYKTMLSGMLCKAHIHAMARRKAVKLFLSHLHEIMYWHHYKVIGPAPYPIVHMADEHVHYIDVPNMYMFPGMAEARKESLERIGKVMRISNPQQLNEHLASINDIEDSDTWSAPDGTQVSKSGPIFFDED